MSEERERERLAAELEEAATFVERNTGRPLGDDWGETFRNAAARIRELEAKLDTTRGFLSAERRRLDVQAESLRNAVARAEAAEQALEEYGEHKSGIADVGTIASRAVAQHSVRTGHDENCPMAYMYGTCTCGYARREP